MKQISFTTNWNNKLSSVAFTTIRVSSETYKVGELFQIKIKGRVQDGNYKLVSKKTILLQQLNDWICYLDTGYSREETINIIKRIHNSREYNWDKQTLDYLLLVKQK